MARAVMTMAVPKRSGASLVVEFIGLPGAGKSTLAHRTAEWLAASGALVDAWHAADAARSWQHRVLRAGSGASFAARAPVALYRCTKAVWGSGQLALHQTARLVANWAAVVEHAYRSRARKGIHLLDQGAWQLVWSIALRSGPTDIAALSRVLCAGPSETDVIVLVRAPDADVRQRLATRPGTRHYFARHAGDPMRFTSDLERARNLMDDVTSLPALTGRLIVVENDHATRLETVAATLGGTLLDMSGGTSWIHRVD